MQKMQYSLQNAFGEKMQFYGGLSVMTAIQERIIEDSRMVAVKDLQLDPNNIRFRHITRKMSDTEMEEWLFNEEDVRVLQKQIICDKRVQQPIYVVEGKHGKYVVKEGNRRTVALRRIQRELIAGKIEGFEKDHFDLMPVNVLKGTGHEINIFLAQIHVSGPKEWNAVNKGSLIFTLMEDYGDTLESVAEELGMTKGKVANYYKAFKATETYSKRYPNDKNYVPKFSYFAELYQSKVLKTWLEEDPSNLDYFTDLVGNNKLLVTYKGVRSFAKIVASPTVTRTKAFNVLNKKDGDIEKAFEVLGAKGLNPKGLWGTVSKLQKTLGKTSYEDFAVALDDNSKLEMLEETITTLEGIRDNIDNLSKQRGV